MYREFFKLIFTKSVSSVSMSVLDKFCDLKIGKKRTGHIQIGTEIKKKKEEVLLI